MSLILSYNYLDEQLAKDAEEQQVGFIALCGAAVA
tara:strand:- start:145 stop:249 length:105 start_codon:yes stop_codon:yes gene_type:complete